MCVVMLGGVAMTGMNGWLYAAERLTTQDAPLTRVETIGHWYRPAPESRRVLAWLKERFRAAPLGIIRSFYPAAAADYTGTIPHQRIILAYGVVTYDLAAAGIALLCDPSANTPRDKAIHERLIALFWDEPSYGELRSRADMPPFDYGGADNAWYVFKILNTEGTYAGIVDPATGLPLDIERNGSAQPYTWDQWQPVSGENAWLANYALRVYQRWHIPGALALSRQLAGTALALQAKNGGIRYAPRGTWLYDVDPYEIVSTENCVSWYGVFEGLRSQAVCAGDAAEAARFQKGMDGIRLFLRNAWAPRQKAFRQSAQLAGRATEVGERFATDVQAWAILSLGPAAVVDLTGNARAPYDLLMNGIERAGVFDENNALVGIDFTDYRVIRRSPLRSVEWGYGYLMALQEGARYYREKKDRAAAEMLAGHARSLGRALGAMRLQNGLFPYSDAPSNSIDVGFGWLSPKGRGTAPWISVASSVWSVFVQMGVNPLRPEGCAEGPAKHAVQHASGPDRRG